jgi:hypothetical protein
MPITINGSGTITGISAGGLPDSIVTTDDIANSAVTDAKIAAVAASKLTGAVAVSNGGTGLTAAPPAFSAYQSSAQSISSGTWTKIQFQTEDFDTASCFDNSTNYRFTPNVAGYYQVTGRIRPNSTNGEAEIGIYKNGSAWFHGSNVNVSSGNQWGTTATGLLYMNGSTDYVEIYLYVTNSCTVSTSRQNTYFQAFFARTA